MPFFSCVFVVKSDQTQVIYDPTIQIELPMNILEYCEVQLLLFKAMMCRQIA
uniref:Uncharacterized protein n=1 Tax=Triticum urartu TaxID=4572 RepID=A0A8R7UWG3_TRIUA